MYRSSLKFIQLVTVVKSDDLVKYGVNAILEPFVDDVKKLESVCIYYSVQYLLFS